LQPIRIFETLSGVGDDGAGFGNARMLLVRNQAKSGAAHCRRAEKPPACSIRNLQSRAK
jgi:hypothetical protein